MSLRNSISIYRAGLRKFSMQTGQSNKQAFEKLANLNYDPTQITQMQDMMTSLRNNPPKEIAGEHVRLISDYETSVTKDTATGEETPITLPKSNVLSYRLDGATGVIVRPSGTEPKIKIYVTSVADTRENAQAKADQIAADMEKALGIWRD